MGWGAPNVPAAGPSSMSSTQNLRRRHQAAPDHWSNDYSSHHRRGSRFDVDEPLDLSMHLPRRPFGRFGNRYDVLRSTTPAPRRSVEGSGRAGYRQPYNRDGKVSKRRRDPKRRWRRQAAAHDLNEQLSQDVDRTLQGTNYKKFESGACAIGEPEVALTMMTPPLPSFSSPHPRLPSLHFGDFDFMEEMSKFTPSLLSPSVLPRVPAPALQTPLPSWCPSMPSWDNNAAKPWTKLPLFFDLSCLPEPRNAALSLARADSQGRELTLRRASPQVLPSPPSKQSRFFPGTPNNQVKCRLPRPTPTACKFHSIDDGPASCVREAALLTNESQLSSPMRAQKELSTSRQVEPTAANLWRILEDNSPQITCGASGEDERCTPNEIAQLYDTQWTKDSVLYDRLLEAGQVPYVHANSLTGHANECAAMQSTVTENTGSQRGHLILDASILPSSSSVDDDGIDLLDFIAAEEVDPPTLERCERATPIYQGPESNAYSTAGQGTSSMEDLAALPPLPPSPPLIPENRSPSARTIPALLANSTQLLLPPVPSLLSVPWDFAAGIGATSHASDHPEPTLAISSEELRQGNGSSHPFDGIQSASFPPLPAAVGPPGGEQGIEDDDELFDVGLFLQEEGHESTCWCEACQVMPELPKRSSRSRRHHRPARAKEQPTSGERRWSESIGASEEENMDYGSCNQDEAAWNFVVKPESGTDNDGGVTVPAAVDSDERLHEQASIDSREVDEDGTWAEWWMDFATSNEMQLGPDEEMTTLAIEADDDGWCEWVSEWAVDGKPGAAAEPSSNAPMPLSSPSIEQEWTDCKEWGLVETNADLAW